MKKISFLILLIFLNFTYCKINTIDDIKAIEGMWEIYSVSSKGEVFYPKENLLLLIIIPLILTQQGQQKN